jgi:hypothetical protein
MKHTARVEVMTAAPAGRVRKGPLLERWVALGAAGGPAVACAVVAFLHLPALRYELISDDEAIYDAMAQVVSRPDSSSPTRRCGAWSSTSAARSLKCSAESTFSVSSPPW